MVNWEISLSYVLNTRPILNFLGIDRLDLLALIAAPAAHVGPSVLREVREHVAWTIHDQESRARRRPESVEPDEIAYADNLRRGSARLRPPLVRRIAALEHHELDSAQKLMSAGRLDPGESEVLAIAQHRGWAAVIDEMAAHFQAEADGIANESTLSLLVQAVRGGRLGLSEANDVWDRIQLWWDYAPRRPLADYLAGRPIWPPCPKG